MKFIKKSIYKFLIYFFDFLKENQTTKQYFDEIINIFKEFRPVLILILDIIEKMTDPSLQVGQNKLFVDNKIVNELNKIDDEIFIKFNLKLAELFSKITTFIDQKN